MQLPQAYRSLPRPSSPLCAKASTVRRTLLDLIALRSTTSPTYSTVQNSRHPLTHTVHQLSKSGLIDVGRARQCGRPVNGLSSSALLRGATRRSRKEVIQPQVPLRLPCYDFAPVTELTLNGCLLAVSTPASGPPSFHGVTGGVYKARERIHRGVADPRLLAIPASCSRVTDCNPNLDRLLAISSPSPACDALYRPL